MPRRTRSPSLAGRARPRDHGRVSRPPDSSTLRAGSAFALLAYGAWGIAPVYWKQLDGVPPFEVLVWRVLSSAVVGLLLVSGARLWRDARDALGIRSVALALLASSLIIGANWFLFLWAVDNDRIVDTSLGYFLTPLLNVALGFLFLRERLRRWQAVAVGLAAIGVARLAVELGGLPWLSLALGGSFAAYGLIRKLAPVPSLVGFAAETAILVPLALIAMSRLEATTTLAPSATGSTWLWLAGSGLMTAGPLVWFASAARRLPLSMVGLFQYLAPSISLGIAVSLYGEPFHRHQLEAFACIWLALGIYTWDLRRGIPAPSPRSPGSAIAEAES